MTVMMIVLVHDELGGRHAGAQDTRRADVEAGHGEAAERALQLVERQAGVEQGAERHVARDAREAIEIQESRHTGWLEVTRLLQAAVPHVAENDVIDHVDAHQDPRRHQPPRQLHIVRTRMGIA